MKSKAKNITPFSGVRDTGSQTSTLKHFFRCTETSGTILRDDVGGCVWDVSAGGFTLTFSSSLGAVRTSMISGSNPVPLASGSWITMSASKQYLFMAACRPFGTITSRISIGDINNLLSYASPAGWGMADAHSSVGLYNDVTHVWTTTDAVKKFSVDANGIDMIMYSYFTPATGVTYLGKKISDATTVIQGVQEAGGGDPTPFVINPCMRTEGVDIYGIAIYEFSSQPDNLLSGIYWNAANWKNGNRYSYPGWIGIT